MMDTGFVVVVLWLADAAIGIGLFGQGRLIPAMLALAALPALLALMAAGRAGARALLCS